ncbi:MAG: Ig-like domain-containing protein, partial [Gemmatimonadetes bacterium]|nr:Ig-like domain-containing protein [Gemmatimonadota bacterium]
MMRPLIAVLPILALASPSIAQEVDRIDVQPTTVSVASGDTVSFSITAYDASGNVISDAPVQGFVTSMGLGQMIDNRRFASGPPSQGQLVFRAGSRAIARVDVVVTPAAAMTVDVGPLPATVAAGGVIPLSATARTRSGDDLAADVTDFVWSTSDPSVATIDPLGNLVTHSAGQVAVSASHRSASAALETEETARAGAQGSLTIEVTQAPSGALAISGPEQLRTGEVGRLTVGGEAIYPRWFVSPGGALIDSQGVLVADEPGTYLVEAVLGTKTAQHVITVEPRSVRRDLKVVGRGAVTDRMTGDLRVFTGTNGRDYAYLGTAESNAILVFDVTDPTHPVLTDSVTTDARYVLDVKVNQDATIGVFSREGAANRANGIAILDLSDPAHPTVLAEYTETVPGGVHNTFFDGDHIYATHDGDGALHIINVSDPANPREVAEWHTDTPGRYLHDLYVKDGVAYLAYWQ